jgi:hypothetical protein
LDGLVERVHHWPGVNGFAALVSGRPVCAKRPRHFFRSDGAMPAEIEMRLSIPEHLGSPTEFVEEVKRRVRRSEEETAAKRRQTGCRVLGRRSVLRQPWWGKPSSFEPRRQMRPRVAARNVWARVEALVRNREFHRSYARARADWLSGEIVTFPIGTYWLHRFANVPIAAT